MSEIDMIEKYSLYLNESRKNPAANLARPSCNMRASTFAIRFLVHSGFESGFVQYTD